MNVKKLGRLLKHKDCGVRYWGAIGCLILQDKAAPLTDEMLKLADDESHDVRAVAAWHLFRIGEKEAALERLKDLLEANTYASMRTISIVNWIGDEAKPLESAVKKHKPVGSYTKQRQGVVLNRLKAVQ